MSITNDIATFQTQLNSLDTTYSSTTINNIDVFVKNLQSYIQSGGANINNPDSESDPLWTAAHNKWTAITTDLNAWKNLNQTLLAALGTSTRSGDISSIMTIISQKQGIVQEKQDILEVKLQDLDISQSRQQSIITTESDQSYLQGFSGKIGFLHPIKPTSVALLLGLGFFIFFVCAIILRDFFTTSTEAASQFVNIGEIMRYTGSGTFRGVLLGIIVAFILYGIGLYLYFYVIKR
jgi:hypothetical protein